MQKNILIILISVIYQAYIFSHNFESISKEIYDLTQRVIYFNNSIVLLFLINMLYITFRQIIKISIKEDTIFDFPLVIFIFVGINCFISMIFSVKLYSLKKSIKNLSAAKGEVYESSKYEEVQIINSVINEI